ncbi:MAG: T9SS type A sorting domain-containing protein [Bacteroidetes bacterium]|nr:T9SS type A sorting domain-containing protein [Bacteroidota bacterium]
MLVRLNSFIRTLSVVVYFSLVSVSLLHAEGTKQLEPTNPATTANRRTRLMFDQSTGSAHRTPFATIGCAEKYRLNVYISDPSTEKIYLGFNDGTNSLFYQVKDPDGVIVTGFTLAQVPASGNGFITSWDQAVAGPKIGTVNPTGYTPKILTPTKTGNYYIEFAPYQSGGSFSGQDMLFFDITVAQDTIIKNGRLWSKAWQLSDDASGDVIQSYPVKLFVYSDDGIVTQLNINEWNGGTYTTYCNQWGVTNTNNWVIDRMSDDTWPGSDLPQYKIFLNNPDINIFPTGQIGHICEVQSHSNCNGSVDIMARVNKPGSLTLNIDVDPPGQGPEDVVLTGTINGSQACDLWDTITWNGLDGNGAPVPSGATITFNINYLNGLTNLPLWDVEDNDAGLIVNIVRPAPVFSTKLPIYWDDSNLPGGNTNAVNGCVFPTSTVITGCHAWSNQNENMINTWWYFSEGTSDLTAEVIRPPQVDFSFTNTCAGAETQFTDQSVVPNGYATAWHWSFGMFGDTSNLQNPVYTFPNSGSNNVLLRVTSDKGCVGQLVKTVAVLSSPVPNAGNDKSIPYATSTTLNGSASGGSGNLTYHWEPASQLLDPDILNPATVVLSETTDFTLTVTDQANSCQRSDIMTVTIIGGPLALQLSATPPAICPGSASSINAQVGGGSGAFIYSWTSEPAGFTSNLEDISVQPDVTTIYTLLVDDGFHTITKTVTVTVFTPPVSTPGASQTIPYGTYTLLSGSASSGLPPYSYSWSPANMVQNPNSATTATKILNSTTNYTLEVMDNHGCTSSSDVLVTIQGGPLQASPTAEPSSICYGASTVLHPMSSGGSGDYTYSWSTNEGPFSTASDPIVNPKSTTTYSLVIDDGFTQSTGSVEVDVYPLPVANLIPAGAHIIGKDTIVMCTTDTLFLNVENPNSEYLWSNGATTPNIYCATTGIAFDMLTYSVQIRNKLSDCRNSGIITVIFDYGECSFGFPEINNPKDILVFPNPGNGIFNCRILSAYGNMKAEISTIEGSLIKTRDLQVPVNSTVNYPIDLSEMAPGIYLLRIYNDRFSRTFRIVKI